MAKKTTTPRKKTAAKPKVVAVAPKAEPEKVAHILRKREFLNDVVEKSGIKKKDAKPVVETTLALLGEAIARGDDLNLPPFGKLKVSREKHLENADVYICRVRRRRVIDGS